MDHVPYFLETRVRQTLERAEELARAKGLVHVFDAELYAANRAVRELLGGAEGGAPEVGAKARKPGEGTLEGTRAARAVLAYLDALVRRLQAAHARAPQGTGPWVAGEGRPSTGLP